MKKLIFLLILFILLIAMPLAAAGHGPAAPTGRAGDRDANLGGTT